MAAVNERRTSADLVPLQRNQALYAAAQAVADDITDGAETSSDSLIAGVRSRLEAKSYQLGRLYVAFAQIPGEVDGVVTAWSVGDPSTFEALSAGDLRDFAVGVGYRAGVPCYLMVGAVRDADRLAEQARSLKDLESVRKQAFKLVNKARKEQGQKPYRHSSALDSVAQGYAEQMLEEGFYGHFSPEGVGVLGRVKAAGFSRRRVGENVASGQPTVQEVVEGWFSSPDHRANLLHSQFSEQGLGVAAGYLADGSFQIRWVQVFASRD